MNCLSEIRNVLVRPGIGIVVAFVLLSGCSGIKVPRVDYKLPVRVLAPVNGPVTTDRSVEFANIFCSVLQDENPDTGAWGGCSEYVTTESPDTVAMGGIRTDIRVLLVPGILSVCAPPDARMFLHAAEHLQTIHGLTVDFLQVDDESSEDNGEKIVEFLREQFAEDSRPYVIVGYSKGAVDALEGLARHPDLVANEQVLALITVAGVIGGSRLGDLLPKESAKWAKAIKPRGRCRLDIQPAFDSLLRRNRQLFFEQFPLPIVRTYSLVAVADEENISKILEFTWKHLSAYELENDSQVIPYEAIVPGANYLGVARGDHWAVAMPFETSSNKLLRKLVSKNHYPRVTLLESLVRIVFEEIP